MKKLGDILIKQEAFSEIVMGNSAIVRAMVEAGTRVVTSYPGSPTPEIATAIRSIDREKRPFYFEFSVNEKVATEVAYGAAVNGHLSTVFFKSVGLNVAADTFVQLSHMNIIGGMVVVLGDDPGANSSQNEQDNRHLARLGYAPVLEPASPEETYRFYLAAARLSKKRGMPVVLRLTTHVCHAKEKVAFAAWKPEPYDWKPRFDKANGPYVPIASDVFPMKRTALARLADMAKEAEDPAYNLLVDNGNLQKGIITMGLPYLSVMDVLQGTSEPPDVLKIGFVHPLPRKTIADFLRAHREVKVVEELDALMEKEAKVIAFDDRIEVCLHGKADMEDRVGEYTPDKVYETIEKTWPGLLAKRPPAPAIAPDPGARPAQMCPGCGHRSAFHAIKKTLAVEDISVADIGCHTLGWLPPYEVGELLMCMGASTGMASGLSINNDTRPVVAFLGDSTFFHAGLPGILNAIFNNHNITLILMENGTTAMTGHQPHPASGEIFLGDPVEKIPLRSVLEGFGIRHIWETDTYMQDKLAEMVKEAMAVEGFSVVIARHPCMLKFTREQRRKPDYVQHHVNLSQEECRHIHTCVTEFACPTFQRAPDGSVTVNEELCIGDGSCIQTCPAKALSPFTK